MRSSTVYMHRRGKPSGRELLKARGDARHAHKVVMPNRVRVHGEVGRCDQGRAEPAERLRRFFRPKHMPEPFDIVVLSRCGDDDSGVWVNLESRKQLLA